MIEIGEFTAVGTDEARSNLNVVLRKRGLHRGADVSVQVAPPATDEEIEALQEAGHLENDSKIMRYDGATDFKIGETDELGSEHLDRAVAIAEKLARFRELDSARVSVMDTYRFGDYSEYVASEVLLVRNSVFVEAAEAAGAAPPPPGPPPADLAHPETQGGLGILTR
jgi:hypothetical protein